MTVYKCNEMIGKVFGKVVQTEDTIDFYFDSNSNENPEYRLMHFQDCCESVYVEDVNGDLSDLVGSPITLAEKSTQNDENAIESGTWTFIRVGTSKGIVVIRFYGESNGYYGEDADFAVRMESSYFGYKSLYCEEQE